MSFTIQDCDQGFTLVETESGQSMHSRIGAWKEAQDLYIAQSQLDHRLATQDSPLVIFDVGMGIAANALAALEIAQASSYPRTLKIVSFENRLDGIRTALNHPQHFPWLEKHRKKIELLLEYKSWSAPGVEWSLFDGNFFDELKSAHAPDLIFYDFYGPKTCPTLWGLNAFERLYLHCKDQHCLLITYSASTAVRSAMLLAGFEVGYGQPTSLKSESTLASSKALSLAHPLDPTWLEKLTRSNAVAPLDQPKKEAESWIQKIRSRPQFCRSLFNNRESDSSLQALDSNFQRRMR